MYQGSCLCGAVVYQLHGEPRRVSHCHCRMCQKQHGAAFATYLSLPAAELQYTQGADTISRYQSSATVTRGFCRHCGSTLEWRDAVEAGGYVALTVATLDTPIQLSDIPHICTESKSSWCPCSTPLMPQISFFAESEVRSDFIREELLSYRIRVAAASDHQAISALLLPLVEKFIAPDCSADGTALLLGSMQPQAILGYLLGDYRYWLAEDAEGLGGVIAVKGSNHLYHLFVAERAQGQGLARQLWSHMLAECQDQDEFTVNASLYAFPVYLHLGFVAEQGPRERMGIVDVPMRLILRSRFAGDNALANLG